LALRLATVTASFGSLTRPTSAGFRRGQTPYPAGYGFPLPFGRWRWLLGPSSPAGGCALLASGLPAWGRTPSGFPRSASQGSDPGFILLGHSQEATSCRENRAPLSATFLRQRHPIRHFLIPPIDGRLSKPNTTSCLSRSREHRRPGGERSCGTNRETVAEATG